MYVPTRTFTLQQANAALPLVRAIARDMVALARDIRDRDERVEQLTAGREIAEGNLYDQELAQSKQELELDKLRLQEYLAELRQLGAEPKEPLQGLVDFPGYVDGRLVFLCWKVGESEITHYHELDAGFAGRRPLVAGTLAGDESPLESDDYSNE